MKRWSLLFMIIGCLSCSSLRQVRPTERTETETHIERVIEKDTVVVEIPAIEKSVMTKDTVSVIENEYAISKATVSGDVLTHSLLVKPVKRKIEVEKEIVYRDKVVTKDKVIETKVEVPVELSGWQSFKMRIGGYLLVCLGIMIVCAILYNVKHSNFLKL